VPIRIYSLAKELKIENKELVDICTKVGITGKGSALASLDDDEVAKVKAYLSGDGSSAAKAKPSDLKSRTPADEGAITRESYIPTRKTDKIKVLDKKSGKPADDTKKKDDGESSKPSMPKEQVVRLAEMPEVKQPVAKPKKTGEKVQKPDIKLPTDAIRAAGKGKSAPLKQFTDSQKKGKGATDKKSGSDLPTPLASTPLGAKTPRGGKRVKAEGESADGAMGDIRRSRAVQRKSRTKRVQSDDDGPRHRRGYRRTPSRGPRRNTAAPRKENVVLELPCAVRSFSEVAGVPAVKICFSLANLLGTTPNSLNINTLIDEETAHLLSEELGVEVEFTQKTSLEDELIEKLEVVDEDEGALEPRPPIVTFLGHVDHGKTSLLDRLIGIDVVSGEAGGITQHIRAYQVSKGDRKVAFVDTPGHEAFTEMRARGANVTDIAVLVVAADDGVMPQTEEAISHAKAAEVPILVALNKMDLPGVDENKAFQDLAARELLPSEWGGDIEVVRTSAITGTGMDELLETLLVTAELHEYKANPNRAAVGTCLEAEQEPGRGVIAKLMVQNGTLKVGDIIVCGGAFGRVKAMYDTLKTRKKLKEAGPSTPVNLTGLDFAPDAGDRFYVLDDIGQAREIAESRKLRSREESLAGITTKVSFEEFQRRLEEGTLAVNAGDIVTLNLIIKADVRGSIEAIQKELGKLEHPEVQVKILHQAVGGVTEGDVTLAHASGAVVIGFNVIPTDEARQKAEAYDVEIRRYDVIYKVSEDIKAMLEGRLKPEERIVELGHALVKEVFQISRVGSIAGCHVTGGAIHRGCRIRVNRDGRTIGDYPMDSLRRHKDDVKEVPRGMECGIRLSGFNDLKEADVLEAYKIEEVARTL